MLDFFYLQYTYYSLDSPAPVHISHGQIHARMVEHTQFIIKTITPDREVFNNVSQQQLQRRHNQKSFQERSK